MVDMRMEFDSESENHEVKEEKKNKMEESKTKDNLVNAWAPPLNAIINSRESVEVYGANGLLSLFPIGISRWVQVPDVQLAQTNNRMTFHNYLNRNFIGDFFEFSKLQSPHSVLLIWLLP